MFVSQILALKATGAGDEMDTIAEGTGGVVATTMSNSEDIVGAILQASAAAREVEYRNVQWAGNHTEQQSWSFVRFSRRYRVSVEPIPYLIDPAPFTFLTSPTTRSSVTVVDYASLFTRSPCDAAVFLLPTRRRGECRPINT